ncbi:MAG: sigma-54-dependent Fis family transcriptional regulator [Halodesulfovibrio sp.]|uniref:sigma-54-dependent Fis family transcriptional regulator n=1 Tax=Halodesulfovibrio sp. TaxID=1912772 RepID=UPI00359DA1EA
MNREKRRREVQQKIRTAWANFIEESPFDHDAVQPHILHSWEISRENHIDPNVPPVTRVLPIHELNDLLTEHEFFLNAADPVLQMVEISIRGTGFIASLAAAPGLLLKVLGDAPVLSHAETRYNVPGALRMVEEVGGSALTMSMIENKPVQISGCEHFNKYFHGWTCSSAPIHDEMEEVVGSLTVSGHMPNKQKHTLALVTAAAATISTRLRESRLMISQQRLGSMLTSIYNSLSDGLLAIDNEMYITHANIHMLDILGLREGMLVGEHIEKIIHPDDKGRMRALLTSGLSESLEVRLVGAKGVQQHMCRILPTKLQSGETVGMTLTITARSQMINIAQQVGGNYAKYNFSDIKGEHPAMQHQISLAKRAAGTNSRILLTGESGTGKELFAQAIHNSSLKRNGPFVAISCAAIPRDLIESELFGYVGGAFTGARQKGMVGKFELANAGTLFLDEINSLPLDMQAKLLRALQQREIIRIGDTKPTPINARIIAATNIDLYEAVQQGEFREDLYYRLNVVELTVPPLRERKEDIPMLANHILKRQSREVGFPVPELSAETISVLSEYRWPGNVRELDNVCERALLVASGKTIVPKHLPESILPRAEENVGLSTMSVQDMYSQLIKRSMIVNNGNLSKVAKELGVARTTLYRNMKKFGLMEE